jgi:DNA-binding XRE family transcriptional regulator
MSDDNIRLAWGQTTDDTGQKRIGVWIQRDDEPTPEGLSLELMEERECSLKEGFLRLARALKGLRPEDIVAHVDRDTFLQALDRLEAEVQALEGFVEEPGPEPRPKRRQRPKTPIRDVLQVGSGHGDRLLHHVFCHKGLLQVGPDSPFPRVVFRWQKQEVAVELSPPEAEGTLLLPEQEAILATKMGEMAQRLGAVDAAVFCILQDLWIQTARHPDERVLCHVDYLLEMRGLKPRRNQDGRAGGYRPEDRAEAIAAVNRLRHLAFDVEYQVREGRGKTARLTSVRRRGRALEVSDTMDLGQGRLEFEPGSRQYELRAFLFSPGPVLAATLMGNQEVGRQVAALNRRALCYNPQKQGLELALALYLATLWRCGASKNGVGVRRHTPGAILEAVGVEVDRRHPSRTLQSLEAALNTLHKDGLIAGWEWDDTRWNSVDFYTERRHAPGWVDAWLQAACVLIEAPAEVAQAYSTIPPARPAPALPATIPSDLGTRLRERRLALGMTGLQAAEQMGIDRTLLGHIETGRRRPSKGAATKILAWLE